MRFSATPRRTAVRVARKGGLTRCAAKIARIRDIAAPARSTLRAACFQHVAPIMQRNEANRPAGRLIVLTQGARWPSWFLRYRDLGPGDAVIAHDSGEALSAFLDRAKVSAVELAALGVAPHVLFLCLPESGDAALSQQAEEVARALVSRTHAREVVLISSGAEGARDGRGLRRLQRALSTVAKVAVEAPRPSARTVARDAAASLVHRLNPGA